MLLTMWVLQHRETAFQKVHQCISLFLTTTTLSLTYTRHTDKLRSGPVFENYTKYRITDA